MHIAHFYEIRCKYAFKKTNDNFKFELAHRYYFQITNNLWLIWIVPKKKKYSKNWKWKPKYAINNNNNDNKSWNVKAVTKSSYEFLKVSYFICRNIRVLIENIFSVINHFSWIFERVGDKWTEKKFNQKRDNNTENQTNEQTKKRAEELKKERQENISRKKKFDVHKVWRYIFN